MNADLTEMVAQDHATLSALVRAYVSNPDQMTLEAKEVPGQVYWTLQVGPNDQGKVIGSGGSHIKALSRLVARIGEVRGTLYSISLNEPQDGHRIAPERPVPAKSYDVYQAMGLLTKVLGALGFSDSVVFSDQEFLQGEWLCYKLFIGLRDDESRESLAGLIPSLSDLFRALGHKAGVKLDVEIQKP